MRKYKYIYYYEYCNAKLNQYGDPYAATIQAQ